MNRVCIAILIGFLTMGPHAAPIPSTPKAFGRVLFSPEERAALEREYMGLPRSQSTTEGPSQIDGVMQRSGGPTVIWHHGAPHYLAPQTVQPAPLPPGAKQ